MEENACKTIVDSSEKIKEFILSSLSEGKDFVLAQAPDVVHQIVGSAFLQSVFLNVVMLILASISFYFLFKSKDKSLVNVDYNDISAWGVICLVSSITLVFSTVFFFLSLHNAISIYLYPKAFLLDKFVF